jgi:hypothetical protein
MSQVEIKHSPGAPIRVLARAISEKWNNFPATILSAFTDFEFIRNFKVREDDIFIVGHPRSGTTRLQEMVWHIVNDFNFEKATEWDSDVRCPYFEWVIFSTHNLVILFVFRIPDYSFKWRKKPMADSLEEMPSPRITKTHLPVQLLPNNIWVKKPRIIFISRNIKDVVVSYYHLLSGSTELDCTMAEFFESFLQNDVMFSPYRENLQNYLNLPDYENILYLSYEGMSADLDGTIRNVAAFLGKNVSIEDKKKLKEHLKFENMQSERNWIYLNGNLNEILKSLENERTNNKSFFEAPDLYEDCKENFQFIRKGVVGGYKTEMPQEYIDRFDQWMAEGENLNQGFAFKKKNGENG